MAMWNFLVSIFLTLSVTSAAALHSEQPINLEADIPLKLQAGGGCRCYCPKDQALAYIADIDATITTYIQMGQVDLLNSLVAQTATYSLVKPGKSTGCYKFQGELDPATVWGCIGCYDWEPIETTYYRNGVIVVRGLETISQGKKIVFRGEVSRYYSADIGCQYRLELLNGSDERCTCCTQPGCQPFNPACRLEDFSDAINPFIMN